MQPTADARRFETLLRPHLGAAYNLARWLTGNESAAHDVVQESSLRAFRFIHRFMDGNARAWFLSIVRNQSYNWLKSPMGRHGIAIGDEIEEDDLALSHDQTPEKEAIRHQDIAHVKRALTTLPPLFREVLVLKEMEDFSYKDIAIIMDIPVGTVMSRLARARTMLKTEIMKQYGHG